MKNNNKVMKVMIKGIILSVLWVMAVVAYAQPKVEEIPAAENVRILTTDDKTTDNDSIYGVVDELAQFPGGNEACMKWLAKHIKYPEDCKKEGIEGRVYVSYVVEKNGSISNIKVTRSPHDSLSEEAIRVVKAMPKWKPAKASGKVVRQRFMLPIKFICPAIA